MIEYELIANGGRQRLYKLSESISKDSEGNAITFGGEPTSITHVALSDAFSHLERQAFAVQFVNCESEEQAVRYFLDHGLKPEFRDFKDESSYDRPFVEADYAGIGGNMSWLTEGWGGSNVDLIMTDEEILSEIIEANAKEVIT